jgi:transposase
VTELGVFIGVDWGSEAHQVCVLDRERRVLGERRVAHDGTSLAELGDWLASFGAPDSVGVAIEMPRGAIVDMLAERGFRVFSVNPKQLDRFRDRHTTAGAKDDRRDAFVLADSLRTDAPAFHPVRVDDPVVVRLREASRTNDELEEELRRHTNRLREQLHRYYPQILKLSPAADDPWVWTLLELAPTPAAGTKLRLVEIKRLLRAHRIRRLSEEDVMAALRTAPLRLIPGAAEAAADHVETLLPLLKVTYSQKSKLGRRMQSLLDELTAEPEPGEGQKKEHRDAQILLSLPGVGRIVGATMLGEASQPLADRDYRVLRAQAGIAPVTRQSGKSVSVSMRRACNQRLRNAVHHWALNALKQDPRSKAHYAALRARGKTHGRALRGIADRLLALLISMLRSGTDYAPSRWVDRSALAVSAA